MKSNSLISRDFWIKWTPRAIAALAGGYYGLGIAYETGLMALVDRIAIQTIKHFFGYVGVGAFMAEVQWYTAWAVRGVIAFAAGITYDIIERCSKAACQAFTSYFSSGKTSPC